MIPLFFFAPIHSGIVEHMEKLKCQWAKLLNHRFESLKLSEVASGGKKRRLTASLSHKQHQIAIKAICK